MEPRIIFGIIIGFAVISTIITVILCIIDVRNSRKDNHNCKCDKCGHEFTYKPEDTIDYEYSGRRCKAVECPNCKNYTKI